MASGQPYYAHAGITLTAREAAEVFAIMDADGNSKVTSPSRRKSLRPGHTTHRQSWKLVSKLSESEFNGLFLAPFIFAWRLQHSPRSRRVINSARNAVLFQQRSVVSASHLLPVFATQSFRVHAYIHPALALEFSALPSCR